MNEFYAKLKSHLSMIYYKPTHLLSSFSKVMMPCA